MKIKRDWKATEKFKSYTNKKINEIWWKQANLLLIIMNFY